MPSGYTQVVRDFYGDDVKDTPDDVLEDHAHQALEGSNPARKAEFLSNLRTRTGSKKNDQEMEQFVRSVLPVKQKAMDPEMYRQKAAAQSIRSVVQGQREAARDEAASVGDPAAQEALAAEARRLPTEKSLAMPGQPVPRFRVGRLEELTPELQKTDPTFDPTTGQGERYSVEQTGTQWAPGHPIVLDKRSKDMVAEVEGDYSQGAVKGPVNYLDLLGSGNPVEQHAVSLFRSIPGADPEGLKDAPKWTNKWGAGVGLPRLMSEVVAQEANKPGWRGDLTDAAAEAYAKGGTAVMESYHGGEIARIERERKWLKEAEARGVRPEALPKEFAGAGHYVPEFVGDAAAVTPKVNAAGWYKARDKMYADEEAEQKGAERDQRYFKDYLPKSLAGAEGNEIRRMGAQEIGRGVGDVAQMVNPLNPLYLASKLALAAEGSKAGLATKAAGRRQFKKLLETNPEKDSPWDYVSVLPEASVVTPQEARAIETSSAKSRNMLRTDVDTGYREARAAEDAVLAKHGVTPEQEPAVMREFAGAMSDLEARDKASPVVKDLLQVYQPRINAVQQDAAKAGLLPDLPGDVARAQENLTKAESAYPPEVREAAEATRDAKARAAGDVAQQGTEATRDTVKRFGADIAQQERNAAFQEQALREAYGKTGDTTGAATTRMEEWLDQGQRRHVTPVRQAERSNNRLLRDLNKKIEKVGEARDTSLARSSDMAEKELRDQEDVFIKRAIPNITPGELHAGPEALDAMRAGGPPDEAGAEALDRVGKALDLRRQMRARQLEETSAYKVDQSPEVTEFNKATDKPRRTLSDLMDEQRKRDWDPRHAPGIDPLHPMEGQEFLKPGGALENFWLADIDAKARGNPARKAELMEQFDRVNKKFGKYKPEELVGKPGFEGMDVSQLRPNRHKSLFRDAPATSQEAKDQAVHKDMRERFLREKINLSPREIAKENENLATMRPSERIAKAMEHVGRETGYVNKAVADSFPLAELADPETGAYLDFGDYARSDKVNRFGEKVRGKGGNTESAVEASLREKNQVVIDTTGKGFGVSDKYVVHLPENMEALNGKVMDVHVARRLWRDAHNHQAGDWLVRQADKVDKFFGNAQLKGALTLGNPGFDLANAEGDMLLGAMDFEHPLSTGSKAVDVWNVVSNTPLTDTTTMVELGGKQVSAGQLHGQMKVLGDMGHSALNEAKANAATPGGNWPTTLTGLVSSKQSKSYELAERFQDWRDKQYQALGSYGRKSNELTGRAMFPKANPEYSAGDSVKAVHMIGQMIEGASMEDAAIGSRLRLMNYGNKPAAHKFLEKTAISPFIFYQTGILKSVLTAAKKNPNGLKNILYMRNAIEKADQAQHDGAMDPRLAPAEARAGGEPMYEVAGKTYRGMLDTPLSQAAPVAMSLSGDSSRGLGELAGWAPNWIAGMVTGKNLSGRPIVQGTKDIAERLTAEQGYADPFSILREQEAMGPSMAGKFGEHPGLESLYNHLHPAMSVPPMGDAMAKFGLGLNNNPGSVATEKSGSRLMRQLLKAGTGARVQPVDTLGESARNARNRKFTTRQEEETNYLRKGK